MATHSSIPAWRIPRTEEPGRHGVPGTQAKSGINTIIYITLKIRNVPNYLNFLFLPISSVSGYTHGVQGNADFYQRRKIIRMV